VAGHILIGTTLAVGLRCSSHFRDLLEWQIWGALDLPPNTISTLNGAGLATLLISGMIRPGRDRDGGVFVFFLLRFGYSGRIDRRGGVVALLAANAVRVRGIQW